MSSIATMGSATQGSRREQDRLPAVASAAEPVGRSVRVIVFSSLFPSEAAPAAGIFIKERMFRVAAHLPVVVVAPQPWSPLDWLVRLRRRSFRPRAARYSVVDGVVVHRPWYFSLPGFGKRFDGCLMAIGAYRTMRSLNATFQPTLIDAHFVYPDGYAATLLGRWLGLPATVTIRGSKDEWLIGTSREALLRTTLLRARHLIAVSDALKRDVAIRLGVASHKVTVIGNGVDLERFAPVDRLQARSRLDIRPDARVLISVGGLVERKGFHRIIPLVAELRARVPGLVYLIVGGGATQEDMRPALEALARRHGVESIVRFCGPQRPENLKWYYGAADVFALATSHEGWANVFLEAMACGLPVVTTRVGGNAEVVRDERYGRLVDYWKPQAFLEAVANAFAVHWDHNAIREYAMANSWESRVGTLVRILDAAAALGDCAGSRRSGMSGL